MADIRINSLPSTATSFNTDDYIAIDGASGGTRKMLAATLPLTDVTLGGSSGPSVKSSLSARAPRQGLVFDGTAGATVSGVPAFGTRDFTVAAWVNPTSLSNNNTIFASGVATAGPIFRILTSGAVSLINGDSTQTLSSSGVISAGKSSFVVYSRTGGTGAFYINGIASGSGPDSYNFSSSITEVGALAAIYERFKGYVSGLIYNRALSASEVVALYEAGAPAGADYNSASNTNISADTFVNGTGAATFSGASATAFTISGTTGGAAGTAGRAVYGTDLGASLRIGTKYRVTFSATITSGEAPIVAIGHSGTGYASNQVTVTNGTNTLELTIDTTRASNRLLFVSSPSTAINYSVSSLVWTRLGLLLAPDAAQAGGGLTWYDTSGNAANITLPASGVSWNVPSSRVLGGNWTTSGNLTVSGTGQSINVPFAADTAILANYDNTYRNGVRFNSSSRETSVFAAGGTGDGGIITFLTRATNGSSSTDFGTERARITSNGNFLIGGTIDGGNGNLQLKDTSGSSTKGIGFGTDLSLYRANTGFLILNDASAALDARIGLYNNGIQRGLFEAYNVGTAVYIGAASASWSTIITSGNGTTALTLDSSQNATFAGTVKANGNTIVSGTGNNSAQLRVDGVSSGYSIMTWAWDASYKWHAGMTTGGNNWSIGKVTAVSTWTPYLTLDHSTGDATFAGFVGIKDGMTAPSATSGTAKIYVDTADGDLKVIFGDGTVKTIVTD